MRYFLLCVLHFAILLNLFNQVVSNVKASAFGQSFNYDSPFLTNASRSSMLTILSVKLSEYQNFDQPFDLTRRKRHTKKEKHQGERVGREVLVKMIKDFQKGNKESATKWEVFLEKVIKKIKHKKDRKLAQELGNELGINPPAGKGKKSSAKKKKKNKKEKCDPSVEDCKAKKQKRIEENKYKATHGKGKVFKDKDSKAGVEATKSIEEKFKNYKNESIYKILNVKKTATTEELEVAFRIAKNTYYPHKHLSLKKQMINTQVFRIIKQAYDYFSKPNGRKEYDACKAKDKNQKCF